MFRANCGTAASLLSHCFSSVPVKDAQCCSWYPGRKSKRTRYESLGVKLPEVDRDLGRTQHGVEPCFDVTTPAQQVRHRNNHRKDARQLHSGYMVTQRGSRPSDGMFDVAGVLKAYERDKFAAGAHMAGVSCQGLHPETPGVPPAPFPLTVHAIRGVSALKKFDGFRAFANHASKSVHISEGYDWTQQLAQEFWQAARSVDRGRGPPWQSAAINFRKVALLSVDQTCGGQGLLVPPVLAFLLGSLRVLREIEMAWAICDDVLVDVEE